MDLPYKQSFLTHNSRQNFHILCNTLSILLANIFRSCSTICPSFTRIKQDADVRELHFSLSSRRLAIKSKWLTLDSSVYNPSVTSKIFPWCLRKIILLKVIYFLNIWVIYCYLLCIKILNVAKPAVLWFKMSPKAMEISVSFVQLKISHSKEKFCVRLCLSQVYERMLLKLTDS